MAALFLSTSRGGFAAAILAFTCLLICYTHRVEASHSPRRVVARLVFGVIALIIAGYVIAGGDLGARLSAWQPVGDDGRFLGYHMILEAIRNAPLTGYGAGTALEAFYLFSDGTLWGAFNYGHNIYLGSVVELGLPASLVLFAAVGLVGLRCLRAIRPGGHDRIFPALGVSLIVLVAVHGLVDSPLILPANAATFSFLLGLAFAQTMPLHSESRSPSSRVLPDRVARRHRAPASEHVV